MKYFALAFFALPVLAAHTQEIPFYARVGAYDTAALSAVVQPAALTSIRSKTAGLYCERKYLMEELSYYQGAVLLPVGSSFFGVSGSWFGNSDYAAWKAGLACARKLAPRLHIGVQFIYAQQQTKGYANHSTVSFDAGFLFHLTPSLVMGIQASHPFSSRGHFTAKDGAVFTMGYSYRPSPQLLLQMEMIKKENDPFEVHAAIRYAFHAQMHGTLGMAFASGNYYVGGGLVLKEFGIDAVLSCHHALGISPGLLITYRMP